MDGISLLKKLKQIQPNGEVIIVTGFGDIETAVQSIQSGAYNYITKPFQNEKLLIDIQKALEKKSLQENLNILKDRLEGEGRFGHLIGSSPAIAKIFHMIKQVALTESTVLILGESGTGKELVAKEIHARSRRRDKPFIVVNCGSLPSTLLESELFGHVKGAFTGAVNTKIGLFEAAHGGTLFLDEIGTANMQTQVGLLRVLQSKEIRKVGSTADKKIDVRILAASNLDLKNAAEKKEFREDLFYRLSAVTIMLPPLRERVEDILPLCMHFLTSFCYKHHKKQKTLSPKAIETLIGYQWPGNVRELEHVMENAVIFSERDHIRPKDLSLEMDSQDDKTTSDNVLTLEEAEEEHIKKMLQRAAGNKLKASKLLKIPRATLYRKIQKYKIE
jgi:DNA-binding NtrC family response regulator